MANFIEAQSALSVQFNADTNLVTTPITLVCNRQYEVVDYNINVIAGNSDNDTGNSNNTTRLTIDSYTAGGVLATALGTVATSATAPASVGTWVRPAVSPIAAAADVVTNALIGSAIVIRSAVQDAMVTVDVEDEGDGIPADLASTVTEPFVTSQEGMRGAGVGLAIVAAFVLTLGGSIHFGRIDGTTGTRTRVRLTLPA